MWVKVLGRSYSSTCFWDSIEALKQEKEEKRKSGFFSSCVKMAKGTWNWNEKLTRLLVPTCGRYETLRALAYFETSFRKPFYCSCFSLLLKGERGVEESKNRRLSSHSHAQEATSLPLHALRLSVSLMLASNSLRTGSYVGFLQYSYWSQHPREQNEESSIFFFWITSEQIFRVHQPVTSKKVENITISPTIFCFEPIAVICIFRVIYIA